MVVDDVCMYVCIVYYCLPLLVEPSCFFVFNMNNIFLGVCLRGRLDATNT